MYLKVVKDIIENYSNLLNKEELEYLSNIVNIIKGIEDEKIEDNIIIYINKLLDKIWKSTLTNINNYKPGEDFCFLVKNVDIVTEDGKSEVFDLNDNSFSLLTNKNIRNFSIFSYGYVINLNYEGNIRTEPLLPMYFSKGARLCCNLNYKISAMYYFDGKLGEINYNYDEMKNLYNKNNFPLILLDKTLYRDKKSSVLLTTQDLEDIAEAFLTEFLQAKYNNIFEIGSDKYRFMKNNSVHKIILSYYNNEINFEELNKKINQIYDNIFNNLGKKKNK